MSLSSWRIQWTSGSDKSLLPAIEHFPRHADALGQFSQNVFLLVAAQFPLERQAGDPLDEDMIEDRDADFE